MLKSRCYAVAVCETEKIDCDLKSKKFTVINNGCGYWVADPFPVEVDGELYIFGEIFEYSKLKGSIGYTKKVKSGFTNWKVVIEEPYHLSFPNLMYVDDVWYMCPETHESEEIYLYRCISFPDRWVKDKVLFRGGRYNDTIFREQNGEIYGFTCIWNGLKQHELKLFKMDNTGKIQFCPQPIHTLDYYMTRPAGKIFYDQSRKQDLMVAQICEPLYGSGLIFKEFELAYPDYTEKELCRFYPEDIQCDKRKKYDGIHTFNVSEHYIVIDVIWSRFHIVEKFYRMLRKLRRVIKK